MRIVQHYFPENLAQKMYIKILDKNSVKNEYIDTEVLFAFGLSKEQQCFHIKWHVTLSNVAHQGAQIHLVII